MAPLRGLDSPTATQLDELLAAFWSHADREKLKECVASVRAGRYRLRKL